MCHAGNRIFTRSVPLCPCRDSPVDRRIPHTGRGVCGEGRRAGGATSDGALAGSVQRVTGSREPWRDAETFISDRTREKTQKEPEDVQPAHGLPGKWQPGLGPIPLVAEAPCLSSQGGHTEPSRLPEGRARCFSLLWP
ncbi:hypothetical protein HJG60_008081 [Phyllostomus discolor]|uniref:Uncharacterized protein n=1 Tax=Phyllostomus discolor TaxID=89673 RepID=A0A834EVV5_9CHIR|nr:hypothetical protein HJG60_008081 [Phyllostomus discolor]